MTDVRRQRVDELFALLNTYEDHATFCERYLTVPDELGVVVPYVERPAQKRLSQAIEKQERAGRPVRVQVLKARRVNMSLAAVSQVWRRIAFPFGPRLKAQIVTQKQETTAELYRYCQHFDQSYKGPIAKPSIAKDEYGMFIGYGEESQYIHFRTAGAKGGSRGTGVQLLHMSETAFWPGGGVEYRKGLMSTISDAPGTMIIDESTANGVGGPFYESWIRNLDAPEWECIFFAWYDHPLYRIAVEDPDGFQRSLTDDEHSLAAQYGLNLEQLAWRRLAIRDRCGSDPRTFQQEYPSSWDEAFLVSGRPRFDRTAIARMPRMPWKSGELSVQGPMKQVRFRNRLDGQGWFECLNYPDSTRLYVAGIDCAQGKDVSLRSSADPDYSVMQVLEVETGDQVACVRLRLEPRLFAEYVMLVAQFYGCGLVIERNTQGFGPVLIQALLDLGFPQGRMYSQERDPGDLRPTPFHYLGYLTTGASREVMLGDLSVELINGMAVTHEVTRHELQHFVILDGKAQGQPGTHDDCVISLALANIGRKWMIRTKQVEREKEAMLARRADRGFRVAGIPVSQQYMIDEDEDT